MDRKIKIYIALFSLLFVGFIYMELSKPTPINWFPSYVTKHKMPYGTYVLDQSLPKLFPSTKIQHIPTAPYLYLQDTTKRGTYFFVNNVLNFGEEEFDRLKEFVGRGNTVFMSTHGATIDELNLKTEALNSLAFEQEPYFELSNPQLSQARYSFDRNFYNASFTEVDTLKTTVLGTTGYLNGKREKVVTGVNFIRYAYKGGHFYFHTFPEAFTNYFLLTDENNTYVSGLLSYIDPSQPLFIDTYYKEGKSEVLSPLHYILSEEAFKWAYYLGIIGVLIYIFFNGKRTQRVIPIQTPIKNQSLAFTRTVANMYFEKSANKAIALHKINYFLNYIRGQYNLSTALINEEFFEQLAARSEQKITTVKALFDYMDSLQEKETVSKEELLALNKKIETFKKQR